MDDVEPLPAKSFSPERKSLKLVRKRSEEVKEIADFANRAMTISRD